MKITVYLYNYTPNIIIFNNINSSAISPNNSILNNININYFSLINHRKYLHFRIYKYRVYIYISQDLWVQSQKMAKKIKKGILIRYEGNLIYYI